MKRTAKLIALAAVLALCLVMTGCYVAPEDDVNNGGETNAGNNLPTAHTVIKLETKQFL